MANEMTAEEKRQYDASVSELDNYPGGRLDASKFSNLFGPIAREENRESRIPASVTLAQAALETGWGESTIGSAKNLFGIKGYGPAGTTIAETKECSNGEYYKINAGFRKYNTWMESIKDHTAVLKLDYYKNAFNYCDDPDQFAREVHKGGYATAHDYADQLISIMKTNNFYKWNVSTKNTGGNNNNQSNNNNNQSNNNNNQSSQSQTSGNGGSISVGTKVTITGSTYATGQSIPGWVKQGTYTVDQINGSKALLDRGGICSWVNLNDLQPVGGRTQSSSNQSSNSSQTSSQTSSQSSQSSGTKLDQLLAQNPSVTTNQDLINLLYKLGGNSFNGAAVKGQEYGVDINALCGNRQAKVARSSSPVVEEPKQQAPQQTQPQQSSGTKLDQLLANYPNVSTNQDLINLLYRLGGGDWNGAAAKGQEYGVDINALCNNRSGAVARGNGGGNTQQQQQQQETPKTEEPKKEEPKQETPKTEEPKKEEPKQESSVDPNSLEYIVQTRGFKTNQDLINYFLAEIGGNNWNAGEAAAQKYGVSLNSLCNNRQGSALDTAKGKISTGGGNHTSSPQTGNAVSGSKAVADFIRSNCPDGINVVFAYGGSNQAAEFQSQANYLSKEYNTIGIKNSSLATQVYKVITTYAQLKQGIADIATSVKKCLADNPQTGHDDSKCSKIKNLSIMCHGYETGLNLGGGSSNNFKIGSVDDFAGSVKSYLATDVRVQLYACNTCRKDGTSENWFERKNSSGGVDETDPYKNGQGSFAQKLAEALGKDASVYGHTTAGHLSGNYAARCYGKDAGNAANGKHMFDICFPQSYVAEQAQRLGRSQDSVRLSMYKYYCNNYPGNNQARDSFIDPEGFGEKLRNGWRSQN